MKKKLKLAFWPAVITVFILAFWLRTVGQNWDEGQGLNPDERFILMVAGSIESVDSLANYFDTHKSTLNPHNKNFGFYVYGTVPLFILRYVADYLNKMPLDILSRQISACFDLGSLILLFIICMQFFNRRVALLAALLYGVSVLPIQLSHFGTFDIHGAFFCTLVLFVSFQAYQYFLTAKSYSLFKILTFCFLAGVAAALAWATKINLVASFGLFPLSVLLAIWQRRGFQVGLLLSSCYGLLAVFFLVLGFRFFQPTAFNGPYFWNFSVNAKWWANITELLAQSSPSIHFPPAVQWIDRTRIHSFLNVITWGLGLPLGIFSLAAFVYGLFRIYCKKDFIIALPLVWLTVGMSLFSFLPWAQPMRYSIPVFSCFAILSALLADKLLTGSAAWLVSRWSPLEHKFAKLIVFSVLLLSTLWSIAFVQIYINPNSRLAASRWMLKNIPAAVNFELLDGSLISVSVAGEKPALDIPNQIGFWPPKDFTSNKLLIPKLIAQQGQSFRLQIIADSQILADSSFEFAGSEVHIPLGSFIDFKYGSHYLINIQGNDAKISKIDLAKETSWDDALPQRVDSTDPYGGLYSGELNLEIYWSDYDQKAARMAKVLNQADYFYLSSNRQVGTVGRLPKVFPIAAAFYQRLLGCSRREYMPECYADARVGERMGDLGFSLIQTFESYPDLFGIEFNTQLADESFQVYDHPKVLLFKNVEHLSVEEIQKRITPARLEVDKPS